MENFDAELAALKRRVSDLEIAAPSRRESRFLRFGAVAGVIATVISILAGAVAVYSDTIRKTEEDRQALYTRFRTDIEDILADNVKIAQLLTSNDNPVAVSAQSRNLTSEKFYAMADADGVLPQIKAMVTTPQLVLLASENASSGDMVAARSYIERAVKIAPLPMRAEALHYQGRILAFNTDPKDRATGLTAFAAAIALLKADPSWGASVRMALTLSDYIYAEANAGRCPAAKALVGRFVVALAKPDVLPTMRQYLISKLQVTLGNQSKCVLDDPALMPKAQ